MKARERVEDDADVVGERHRLEPARLAAQPDEDAAVRLPVEVLHGDELPAVLFAELVRLNDVGVVHPGREPGLVEEHREDLRLEREVLERLLDDDELVEPARALGHREVHLGHAAASDLGDQAVAARRAFVSGHAHR